MGKLRRILRLEKKAAPPLDAEVPCPPSSAISAGQESIAPILPNPAQKTPPDPLPTALPDPVLAPILLSDWHITGDAVMGLSHRKKNIPCQDAVFWKNTPRPILALSDGAGSAVVSEKGAAALVMGIPRFLTSMEDEISPFLDEENDNLPEETAPWASRILRHAKGLLDDVAHAERRSVKDLRATLLLVVIGKHRIFWWQVGDGAIVVSQADGLKMLGSVAAAKGEFANQTCFVDMAQENDVQYGLLPVKDISGIALMSDGGAEKLVSHDGSKVAPRLGEWLKSVADERFCAADIAVAFHEPAMNERTTLDDRSIVIASR